MSILNMTLGTRSTPVRAAPHSQQTPEPFAHHQRNSSAMELPLQGLSPPSMVSRCHTLTKRWLSQSSASSPFPCLTKPRCGDPGSSRKKFNYQVSSCWATVECASECLRRCRGCLMTTLNLSRGNMSPAIAAADVPKDDGDTWVGGDGWWWDNRPSTGHARSLP